MELYIEIFGVVTGLIYLYLQIRQNAWMWIVCIATSLIFAGLFMGKGLFANMCLQLYFVCAGIYGIWAWKFRAEAKQEQGIVYRRLDWTTGLCAVALVAAFAGIIFAGLSYSATFLKENISLLGPDNGSELKRMADAFTAAGSIVATGMLAFKVIEHWLFWIVSDTVSIILLYNSGLYPTAILYACYIVLAIIGFNMWLKKGRRL